MDFDIREKSVVVYIISLPFTSTNKWPLIGVLH
jgi:hypothetical protein